MQKNRAAMAEPFKHRIDPELIALAATHLRRVQVDFPHRRFVALATAGLAELELKQRVVHVAAALAATLPMEFAMAVAVLERSLAPARNDDDLSQLVPSEHGLAGWFVWTMTEFVATRGLAHPVRALAALHAMTQRYTAEFAIRPFLIEHEAITLATLGRWATDQSPHVRRLVSEGSRPRLPWGQQLRQFVADPTPTLPLLAALQDDPSEYVRRSVANHLNDIAKDHPDVVAAWLEQHLEGASSARRAMLKHASRTLVKRGDRRVLAVWGFAAAFGGEAELRIVPSRVAIGGSMQLQLTLRSTQKRSQRLVVDYVVQRVRRNGALAGRVRKGWVLELAAGETRVLTKKHSWQPVTTRVDEPGKHTVTVMVNGRVVAEAAFDLRA